MSKSGEKQMKVEPKLWVIAAFILCIATSIITFHLFKPQDAMGDMDPKQPPVILAVKILEMKVECPVRQTGPMSKGTMKLYGVGPNTKAIKDKVKQQYPECKILRERVI
jgi:hypothetical protein